VTNLLEEDQALKDKVKILEEENTHLKMSIIQSGEKSNSKVSDSRKKEVSQPREI
jgi:hypothetical protein